MGAWISLGILAAAYAKAFADGTAYGQPATGDGQACEALVGSTTEVQSHVHDRADAWRVELDGNPIAFTQANVRRAIDAAQAGQVVLLTSTDADHYHEVVLTTAVAQRLAETGELALTDTGPGVGPGPGHVHRATVRCGTTGTGTAVGYGLGSLLGRLYE